MRNARQKLAIMAACFFLSGTAVSHTQLSSSTPADEAVLEAAPTEIVLSFSEAVRLTAITISSGDQTSPIKIELTDPSAEFAVALPDLSPGNYVVEWRALSQDTHVVTGEIRFSIAS